LGSAEPVELEGWATGRGGLAATERGRRAFGLGGVAALAAAALVLVLATGAAEGATLGGGASTGAVALGGATGGCVAATPLSSSVAGDEGELRDSANVNSDAAAAEASDEINTKRLEER
jgi:hypothetical protein